MNDARAMTPHIYTVGGRAYRSMFKDRTSQVHTPHVHRSISSMLIYLCLCSLCCFLE